ncbi:hypothetical protein [Burkholderia phage BCSR129]|nr:hypothetical protein [Burkholderia phage BCSR129]
MISHKILRIAVVSLIIVDLAQFVYIRKISTNIVVASQQMASVKDKCVDRLNLIDSHLTSLKAKEKPEK